MSKKIVKKRQMTHPGKYTKNIVSKKKMKLKNSRKGFRKGRHPSERKRKSQQGQGWHNDFPGHSKAAKKGHRNR